MPSHSISAGFRSVEEVLPGTIANERYLRNESPLARVAMVYSQQTATYYGWPEITARVDDPALGFYQALIEARIPFEMVHDRLLDVRAPEASSGL